MSHRLTLLAVLLLAAAAVAQKPRIEASEPGWDFGVRDQGQKDRKVIKLRNVGDAELKIEKMRVTCGCIDAELKVKTIPAGGEVDLDLTLDTNRGQGEVKKFVILDTNDPEMPHLKLSMTGTIHPFWWLSIEKAMQLGEIRNGGKHRETFDVLVRKGTEVKLGEIEIFPRLVFEVTKEPFELEDGTHGWHIHLDYTGRLATGGFEGGIFVNTDFESYPRRAFRFSGRIVSATSARPRNLSLGAMRPGQTVVRTVTVHKETSAGLEIVSVLCEDPRVKTRIIEKEAGRTYDVEVSVTPDNGRDVRGKIVIQINEPGELLLEIPTPEEFRALAPEAALLGGVSG